MRAVRLARRRASLAGCLGVFALAACGPGAVESAEDVVEAAIERHGGDAFDRVSIRWDFREIPFGLDRDGGVFRYQRLVPDDQGRPVLQVMENEGTWIEQGGQRIGVDDQARRSIETAVNSVVYLGFLPFRLDDEGVQLEDLGTSELEGREYRKIGVTFGPEDGGRDWEDRFVYWFRDGDWALDYLAYWEATDPPTTRFRRAINRREVNGLVIQDYENYTADGIVEAPEGIAVAEYDRLFEEGQLRLVSMIEFENVRVTPEPEFPEATP